MNDGLYFNGHYVKPGAKIKVKGSWKTYIYVTTLCFSDPTKDLILCEDYRGRTVKIKPGSIRRVLGKRSYLKNV